MTNGNALKEAIKAAGVSIAFLAEKLNSSRNRVYAIIHGADCTASEISTLTQCLHLTKDQRDYIFLSESVN